MTIEDNINGRAKAGAAIAYLMDELADSEVRAAMVALRAQADSILGPQEPQESTLSTMDDSQAKAFRNQTCRYTAYSGVLWRDVPREYIETLADFGLELQRYLRSELGKNHG